MSTDAQVEQARSSGSDAVRLLVIQLDANCDLDRMGAWLETQDVVVEVVHPYQGETVPSHCDYDGLIVLGGFLSSNDDGSHPWLENIRTLIRATVNADIPMLGICLGGQLLGLQHAASGQQSASKSIPKSPRGGCAGGWPSPERISLTWCRTCRTKRRNSTAKSLR